MRQERFTEQAQEAIQASQQLATQYHHSQWDVEHILLSLLMQKQGLVGEILKELKVEVEAIRNRTEEVLSNTPKVAYQTGQIYATPRIAQMMNLADEEAKRLKLLEDENNRLKKIVGDQALDIQMLKEITKGN